MSTDTTSTSISFDTDGDGCVDTTYFDDNLDGLADSVEYVDCTTGLTELDLDMDFDGDMDVGLLDFDSDGIVDLAVEDFDNDGWVEELPLEDETLDPTATTDPVFDVPVDTEIHGDPMVEMEYHQVQVGDYDCAPTAAAMVLTELTGAPVDGEEVVDLAHDLGIMTDTGMLPADVPALFAEYGIEATIETGSMDELRTMLDEGTDVIVALDADDLYGTGDQPFADDLVSGHAVVITGIDDEAGLVYINDPGFPDGAGVAIPIEAFDDGWADMDHQMIVAEETVTDAATGVEGKQERVLLPFTLKV